MKCVYSNQRSCRYCNMDAPHWRWLNEWRKGLTAISQECCEQYWTSSGDSTRQSSSYMATYHPSRKLSKLDEPDTRDTAGEVGTRSWVMYFCGTLYMHEQSQDVQLEPTYSRSVPRQNVALRFSRKQWTLGRCGERGSGISGLWSWHEDDDDDDEEEEDCIWATNFSAQHRTCYTEKVMHPTYFECSKKYKQHDNTVG